MIEKDKPNVKCMREESVQEGVRTCNEQGIWGIRTDHAQRELCKSPELVSGVKRRLEWVCHVITIDYARVDGNNFEITADGGRSRLRWVVDVENDLGELKLKSGRQRSE
jgi:hypothetical protein